jgi:hypothetical protein
MQPANHHDFPDRIGEWIPERVIGRGAVAGVYLCRDAAGDEVALKWMDASMSIHFERFEREIHVLARLDHPSIVGYRDHGVFQGRPFLVMDYIEGQDLRLFASKLHLRPPAERYLRTRTIGIALCEALAMLHDAGLVHRDVKPSNVMIAQDDRVVLTDFGVVKDTLDVTHTAVGIMVGTLAYAAPEQIVGDGIDARTDLYGLGGCLYFTLTHRRPFFGLERVDSDGQPMVPPSPSSFDPGIPPDLEGLVMRLLAADPKQRPRNAASVCSLLAVTESTGPQLAGTAPILKKVADCLRLAASGVSLLVQPTGPMGTRKSWVGDLLRQGAQRQGIPVVEVLEAGAFQAVRQRLAAGEHLLVVSPLRLPVPPEVEVVEILLQPLGVADIRRSLVLAAPLISEPAAVATQVHALTGGLPRLVAALLQAHTVGGVFTLPDPVPVPPEIDRFFEGLDIDEIELLGAIAAAGGPVLAETLEDAVQIPAEDVIETLVQRGMVVLVDGRVCLLGTLFQTAVQALLPDPEGLASRIQAAISARFPVRSVRQRLLADVRESIAQAEAAMVTGAVNHGLESARRSVMLAQRTRDGVVECEASITLGSILIRLGLLEEATRHLSNATALAHADDRDDLRRMCHALRAWVSLDRSPNSRMAASDAIDRILPMIAGAETRGHQPEDALLFATWARAAAVISDVRSWHHAKERAQRWALFVARPVRFGIGLQLARAAIIMGDKEAARAYVQPVLVATDLPIMSWEAARITAICNGTSMPSPGDWAQGLNPTVMDALHRRTP